MASNRAPGVKIKEIDVSEVIEPVGTGVGAIVGRTPAGLPNMRVLTTSNKNFVSKFGSPSKGDANEWPMYTALEYLKASDYLWFTRPAGYADKVGYATFSFSDSQFDNTKTKEEAPEGSNIYVKPGYEDGNKPNKYWPAEQIDADLVVCALGASEENSNIGIIVVTENNTETSTIDYTYGYTWAGQYPETDGNGNAVKYYRINVYVKSSDETAHDAGWDDLDALKTLTPVESWIVSNNPTAKDFSGNSMFVKDVVNGFSNYIYVNATGSSVAYTDTKFYPEAGWEFLENSAVPMVSAAVKDAATSDASAPDTLEITMSGSSPSISVVGKKIILEVGMSATAVSDWTLSYAGNQLVLTNDDDSSKVGYYTIPGWTVTAVDGAQISVVVGKANLTSGTVAVTAGTDSYAVTGSFTSADVLESVANGIHLKGKNVAALPAGTYTMGTDGIVDALQNLYKSKEQVGVDFFMAPYSNDACVQAVCEIAKARGGCLAIAPANVNIEVTDPQTLINGLDNKSYLRNSYVYIIAGADLVYDPYTSKNIYLPKVCFVGRIVVNTIDSGNVWDAPAGLNRGAMDTLDQLRVYTEAEIGAMYNKGINTSKRVRGMGDFLWGEKTGQIKHSALDRVHVRNELNYIENTLEPQLQAYLFEANTETLRSRVKSNIDQFLETIYAGGGLYAWKTVCDSTNNTPYTIDNEELNIDIYVQPVKDIEYINVNVVITRTGVSFTEA